jgi:hypothetical protein
LDDSQSNRKYFTHGREARRHMVMPRAGFEATILVTIISDMSGIVHCPGVIVPQYLKKLGLCSFSCGSGAGEVSNPMGLLQRASLCYWMIVVL